MKTRFDNHGVAQAWAKQAQSFGQSGNGNLYFRDSTIFSYGAHFPIARIVTNKAGKRAILFTTARHSVTTNGKHIPAAARAARSTGLPIFNVYFQPEWHPVPAMLDEYAHRYLDAVDRATYSRKYKEQIKRDADAILAEAQEFAEFFGFPLPPSLLDLCPIHQQAAQ